MINYLEHQGPMGRILLAATSQGLCGLYFEQHRYFGGAQHWQRQDGHTLLLLAVTQVNEYFAGQRTIFDLELDLRGTPFQQRVWKALQDLPFGVTTSYQQIARLTGNSGAVRAVGSAIGRNPVSIIVPCHRVLGVKGGLSGYAGGLERKQYLLEHEKAR